MKSEAMAHSHPEQIEVEDLASLMDRAERALKLALAKVRRTRGKTATAAKRERADEIQNVVEEIERIRLDISDMTVVVLPTRDQYVVATLRSILPKLPTLIENKRDELLQQDVERFVESVMPSDPLKDVLLDIENDNVSLREDFVRSNACLDSKTLAKNAGYKATNLAQTAWRWKTKGQIFSVDYFGTELFPAFQFRDGKPLPTIKRILDAIGKQMSPWQLAFWFVAENGWLDGQRPVDVMMQSEDEVLEAAKRAGKRAYY